MFNVTAETIREIAEQLDCGFRAFIHKTTRRLLFVPDEDNFLVIDRESWGQEFEELESNESDYHEVGKWTSREAFGVMRAFADQLTDHRLHSRLIDALGRKKPFREFKHIVDSTGEVRQQWFDFKGKWQEDFVARQLSRLEDWDE